LPSGLKDVPIIVSLYQLYTSFHRLLSNFPKTQRYSLGQTVQTEILNIIRHCLQAAGTSSKQADRKRAYLTTASSEVDTLRLLLCLCKDCRCISNTAYQQLDSKVTEIGKMLGGWIKSLNDKL